MTIYFDMDGTLADLYGVENWLSYLEENNPYPYMAAKPLLHLATFARYLNKLQGAGWKIGIVSWLSKCSNIQYDNAVTQAKMNWLKKHLPSVKWNEIKIVPFGTPKSQITQDKGILFDDETQNLVDWYSNGKGQTYYPDAILEVLKFLARGE